jgi:hypothetical protein
LSIRYANIFSRLEDHRKKLSNLRIGSGRTNESNEIYKKEACVARKHLKKRGSEEKNSYPSSQK